MTADADDLRAADAEAQAWLREHYPEDYLDAAPERRALDPLEGTRFVDGGAFILDAPTTVPALWGAGSEILWARGESLILAGPPGVGKTTLTGQIVRGLLGLQDHVLDFPIEPATGRVVYLAMDRPTQIGRSLRRHFAAYERDALTERLAVWPGPPPADIARHPELLASLAARVGATHVILDSLKDAAIGLADDEVGAGYNRARQTALAAGVELLELHHVVKRGANGSRPNTLADLYGSAWLSAGAGSVVLLWGAAGDPIVDLTHLKPPAEPVGPLRVIHDHAHGTTSIWHATDPLAILRLAGTAGATVAQIASALFETDKPDRNELEKARRKLDALVATGHAEKDPGAADPRGGPPRTVYRALTHALTDLLPGAAPTQHARTHAPGETAGQPLTAALTALTDRGTHVPTPPCKGGRTRAATCPDCGDPLDGPGVLERCKPNHNPGARA